MPHREGVAVDYLGLRQASDTSSASSDVPQRSGYQGYDPTQHLDSSGSSDSLPEGEALYSPALYSPVLDFALDSPSTEHHEINNAAVGADDPFQFSGPHSPKKPTTSTSAVVASSAVQVQRQIQQRPTRSYTVSVVTNNNPNQVIKRKPLSPSASALGLGIRYSSYKSIAASLDQRPSRSQSLDTPARSFRVSENLITASTTTAGFSAQTGGSSPPISTSIREASARIDESLPSRNIPQPWPAVSQTAEPVGPLQRGHEDRRGEALLTVDTAPHHSKIDALTQPTPILEFRKPEREYESTDGSVYSDSESDYNSVNDNAHHPPNPILVEQQPSSPAQSFDRVDSGLHASATIETATRTQVKKPLELNKPLPRYPSPKSPVLAKFGTLFSWGSHSPSNSEFSSIPSPGSLRAPAATDDTPPFSARTHSISDRTRANAPQNALGYCEGLLQTPPPGPVATPSTPPAQIEEMEEELKAISAELAASIRRELDLESLVDRLQTEVNNPSSAPGKRTSDYYSDSGISGISSAKFSEYDQTREEVERVQRRAEQEKAQLRLELTTKLQDERSKRRELDKQILLLSERASQVDLAQVRSRDASGRLQELENTCEDLRRKLAEERQVKDNFEDLLSVFKGELQTAANERDNLRDEIVPQLRARVEGLEAQAGDFANLTYESTKIQQQLQTLKTENDSLRKSREETDAHAASNLARARSSSITGKVFKLQQPPAGLGRSNTVNKGAGGESREILAERLKDVEAQRDALHNALKSLLERQEFQNRENEKKIKILEIERDRLLTASPKKASYETDISNLRHEVKVLRKRAQDAVDQKWQVEKSLIGIKMDLDRAEEEIASLRAILKEKDILIPSTLRSSSFSSLSPVPVSSESLERAYRELQDSYTESLERIKKLEAQGVTKRDEKMQLAVQRLELSLSSAICDRDAAKQEAAAYRTQLDALTASEAQHLQTEWSLSEELRESARRVEELAVQVQAQLAANTGLRDKLSAAVSKGDADRKANVEKVFSLQNRLKSLEDQLVAAQAASEDRIARHEEELFALSEAHNQNLRRVSSSPASGGLRPTSRSGGKSPAALSPARGRSPMPSPRFPRSPKQIPTKTLDDEVEVARLRDRVAELERALADADHEMQQVVETMSTAQIEVMTLQEEREKAVRETRRLRQIIDDEKMTTFEERFKTLARSGTVR